MKPLGFARLGRFARAEDGAAAVEFVLVLGACLFLVLGTINMSLLLYSFANLNSAVDDAARWASVQTALNGSAPTSSAIQTYAGTRYKGAGLTSLAFTATKPACGNQVVGSGTFRLLTGLYNPQFTLTAQSCFS